MIPKHEKLIDDLFKKTESGDVRWEPTDAENQFALKLSRGAILLDRTTSFLGDNFAITILNHQGKQIDRIDLAGEPSRFTVGRLFDMIDRRVNRIDEQIDEIIGELETL